MQSYCTTTVSSAANAAYLRSTGPPGATVGELASGRRRPSASLCRDGDAVATAGGRRREGGTEQRRRDRAGETLQVVDIIDIVQRREQRHVAPAQVLEHMRRQPAHIGELRAGTSADQ